MNLAQLERKLIAAGRAQPPDGRVPYAFEKRILARLAGRSVADRWELWARALWRAAAACAAITLLLGAWSFLAPRVACQPAICRRTSSRPSWRQWIRIKPLIQAGEQLEGHPRHDGHLRHRVVTGGLLVHHAQRGRDQSSAARGHRGCHGAGRLAGHAAHRVPAACGAGTQPHTRAK